MSVRSCLIVCAVCIGIGLLTVSLRSVDPPIDDDFPVNHEVQDASSASLSGGGPENQSEGNRGKSETERSCATVEEMGEVFKGGFLKESLRVRRIIQDHFLLNGTIFAFLYVQLDFALFGFRENVFIYIYSRNLTSFMFRIWKICS